ncbi:MAG: HAMP domain-containing protein [Herpetosiphonaceae bacterium]|nr:HAMP domain-containing protein [Herpetosiphonaceae bacterium]
MRLTSALQRLQPRSLRTKVLLPIFCLMIASLLMSTLAFVVGTARTRDQLLASQTSSDLEQVEQTLLARADVVQTASTLLAKDPAVSSALRFGSASELETLNNRAVIIRERFQLDLVQIYNDRQQARTNLVLASLYRQSSLLGLELGSAPQLQVVDGQILLLSRSELANNGGTIITGIDVQVELERILAEQRLPIDLIIQLGEVKIATDAALLAGTPATNATRYISQEPFPLGGASLTLGVVRQTAAIAYVASAGLAVMIGSSLITTILLLVIGVLITRSITRPVQRLAEHAHALAAGDLAVRSAITTNDELATLAHAFNTAADRLTSVLQHQRRETQRERAILASIGDGVLVSDAAGQIVVLNTAAYQIIGEAEAERLQQMTEIDEESPQFYAALEAIQPMINQVLGGNHTASTQRLTLAGRTFRLNTSPIWLDDDLLGAVANLHDISAEVESERIKGDFIAIAAHELRTPLTSIRGFTDLLKWTDISTLSTEQKMFVDIINRNVMRLNDLVNDLLDISRLDQQKADRAARPVDIALLTTQAAALIYEQALQKTMQISTTLAPNLPLLSLDPSHMTRVLHNLLSNAIKYTPDGGTIHIQLSQRPGDILLAIQDSGVGIPLKDQPRIFGRFFRAENPLSEQVGGTGLGLAITKSLVELNQCSIYFESVEGSGTTFYVAFPLALACESLPAIHHYEELAHAA